jgi:hypothetical protein
MLLVLVSLGYGVAAARPADRNAHTAKEPAMRNAIPDGQTGTLTLAT